MRQQSTGHPFPRRLQDRERPVSRGALPEEKGLRGPEPDNAHPLVTSCPNKSPESRWCFRLLFHVHAGPFSAHRSLSLPVGVLLCRLFLKSGISPGTLRFMEPGRIEQNHKQGEEGRWSQPSKPWYRKQTPVPPLPILRGGQTWGRGRRVCGTRSL